MSVSFTEAREAVEDLRVSDWSGTWGTLYVSPDGFADEDDYLVVWGPREYIVDDNPYFILLNNTATFVDRQTGEVRDVPYALHLDKIDAMAPVRAE